MISSWPTGGHNRDPSSAQQPTGSRSRARKTTLASSRSTYRRSDRRRVEISLPRASRAQPPDLSRGVGAVQTPRIEQLAPFGEQVVRLVQRLYLAEIDVPKGQFGRGSILLGFLSPALERRAKAVGRDVPS